MLDCAELLRTDVCAFLILQVLMPHRQMFRQHRPPQHENTHGPFYLVSSRDGSRCVSGSKVKLKTLADSILPLQFCDRSRHLMKHPTNHRSGKHPHGGEDRHLVATRPAGPRPREFTSLQPALSHTPAHWTYYYQHMCELQCRC